MPVRSDPLSQPPPPPATQAAPAEASVEAASAPLPPTLDVPLSPKGLARAWSKIVSEVGRRRRTVRESLAQARPVAVEGDRVVLDVSHGEAHLEGLERTRRAIQDAIEAVTGHRVQLTFRSADETDAPDAEPAENGPTRLHDAADRVERFRGYRSKDPALDAAADVLDLELLE
jgi:hypothetical protein